MNWHLLPLSEITQLLNTSPEGLDKVVCKQRQEEYGPNQIEEHKKKSVAAMIAGQLTDFMILILIAAAIVSGMIGDITDTIIILAIVILNALVGFIQEYRAEKAIAALKEMAALHARVKRGNEVSVIPATMLVPGDVVILEAGDMIPADLRFFESQQIRTDESVLTGESQNVEKHIKELTQGDYPLGDRHNMGYKGTFVTHGRGSAYVVATGMKTQLGKIATMIQTEDNTTPLQKRLSKFGKKLSVIILFICAVIFVIGSLRGESMLNMLLTSISLAVAAIPEALPALVTIALAFGARKLVKSKALIRKLPAVETLGSVTYICTDKTGTLTVNKMTVMECEHWPIAELKNNFVDENVLFKAMALNNDIHEDKEGKHLGDSTEIAMLEYAEGKGFMRRELEKLFPRVAELPFDSTRKCMTTIHKSDEEYIVITKGAVDVLLNKVVESQTGHVSDIAEKANSIASEGHRVLGFALRNMKVLPQVISPETIETSLHFTGFAGMIDPPREEVPSSIKQCREAGIVPVMITGDHKLTATAIARQLGIMSSEEDRVITGPELNAMKESEFEKIVEHVKVYARVSPEQKLKIVNALQHKHHYVAMTGDGVNDAPALKNADIGVAMGINGTEVSKEASHMILLDDNFATIISAISHGRRIFDNILKFIKYIMTGNSGEIWAILLAPFFGLPIPLLAIHILWINLVTDGLPGLALASEPAESGIMKRTPRDPRKSIFADGMALHILWIGFLMGVFTIGIQAWSIYQGKENWQTMAFTVLCFSQLGHVMAIRSGADSIFKIGVFSNRPMLLAMVITCSLQILIIYHPVMNEIFKTQPLSLNELAITLAVSSIVFWIVEIEKHFRRKRTRNNAYL
ncbi:MAG: cation-translocating P-type ATPase [Bacteroidetes bacterium]|nr:MAG: cation-translocating P-type ATPase [Bacteroidota bacterium]REJ99991.1 MAG: cation-translocating P-type ATPase [Bacteroidota bacterium]REK35829.1 MAG: cation-translocating P-type ATPase [Bacteroidota bacterium]REK49300.1 MAG: cation-translocating P-type ATPase [Bacteroidota bacterium]